MAKVEEPKDEEVTADAVTPAEDATAEENNAEEVATPAAEEVAPAAEEVEAPAEETEAPAAEEAEAAEEVEAPAAEEAATPAAEEAATPAAEEAATPVAEEVVAADDDSSADDTNAATYSTATPEDATPAEETPKAPRVVLNVPGAAVGRRKQAIARVRIAPGSGTITVNGRELAEYFPNKLHQQLINDPFKVLDLLGSYDVVARITGGGPSGQAGALRLGIARSLNQIDEENNRASLKKAGFLSRDARVKERKKAGLKKARKAPQFSKR